MTYYEYSRKDGKFISSHEMLGSMDVSKLNLTNKKPPTYNCKFDVETNSWKEVKSTIDNTLKVESTTDNTLKVEPVEAGTLKSDKTNSILFSIREMKQELKNLDIDSVRSIKEYLLTGSQEALDILKEKDNEAIEIRKTINKTLKYFEGIS